MPTYFQGVRQTPLDVFDSNISNPCFLSRTTMPTWSKYQFEYQTMSGWEIFALLQKSGYLGKARHLHFHSVVKNILPFQTAYCKRMNCCRQYDWEGDPSLRLPTFFEADDATICLLVCQRVPLSSYSFRNLSCIAITLHYFTGGSTVVKEHLCF